MRQYVIAWVAGTAVYVVSLLAGGFLIAGAAQSSGDIPPTWPLLVVPAALGAAVAVLALRARTRPTLGRGTAAVAAPALVAGVMGLAANTAASARTEVPPSVLVTTVVVPVVVMLLVGAGFGLLRGARWSEPAAPVSAYEPVA